MKTKTPNTSSPSFDIDSIYAGISAAETQKSNASKGDRDYLKPKVGNTYLVKLLPYKPDISKTFTQYDFHGWQSIEPGRQYVTTGACPRTWGDQCVVCDAGYAAYNRKEQFLGELKSKLLLKRTQYLVNVFVIDDPANPENNGTVKVLRYGPVVNQKFHDALFGDDKDELGKRVFDFSPEGVHFKIQVERKGGNPKAPLTYEKSKFMSSAKLTFEHSFNDVLEMAKDLTTLIPKTKSDSEIITMLDKHFHGVKSSLTPSHDTDGGDDDGDEPKTANYKIPNQSRANDDMSSDIDADVASLLEGLSS